MMQGPHTGIVTTSFFIYSMQQATGIEPCKQIGRLPDPENSPNYQLFPEHLSRSGAANPSPRFRIPQAQAATLDSGG